MSEECHSYMKSGFEVKERCYPTTIMMEETVTSSNAYNKIASGNHVVDSVAQYMQVKMPLN